MAQFVLPGTALDREAESRGSSFYRLTQDHVPMLPERVSHDLCSLLPNQERLTMSLFITMNMRAEVMSVDVRKTIIKYVIEVKFNNPLMYTKYLDSSPPCVSSFEKHSHVCPCRSQYRLDYEEAEAILTQGQSEYPEMLKVNIMFLYKIAKMWRGNRLGKFPAQYHPLDPECTHTPKSHALVEEIMVMANHQVCLCSKPK